MMPNNQATVVPLKKNIKNQPEVEAFADALTALIWATEVLRAKRFPSIPSVYANTPKPAIVAAGGSPEGDDAYAQALSIYQCLYKLDTEAQEILQLHVWGDYATPPRLHAALKLQEQWRQQGKRVRLSYRYSHRQLGTILGCSKSSAWRKLNTALKALASNLLAERLIE